MAIELRPPLRHDILLDFPEFVAHTKKTKTLIGNPFLFLRLSDITHKPIHFERCDVHCVATGDVPLHLLRRPFVFWFRRTCVVTLTLSLPVWQKKN